MIRTTIFALAAAGACYLYAASPRLDVGQLARAHGLGKAEAAPEASRDIPWQGGDSLTFVLDGDVRYTQAPIPKITVVGPRHVVADLEMRGDTLAFRNGARWKIDGLQVDIAAPSVKHFTVAGDQNLIVKNYAQDDLAIDVNGSGDVLALGKARKLAVTVRGSGNVDVSAVAGQEGRFEVIGSGDVRAAPTGLAQVNIVGSGEVDLVREPKQVASNVVGSGGVRRSPVVLRAP
jgi:Putative auto-transporter adhesin, head GIN domain